MWKYRAQNPDNVTVEGTLNATSYADLVEQLEGRGLMLLEYEEPRRGIQSDVQLGFLDPKPGVGDLANFAKQMSVMQRAGVDIVYALKSIGGGTRNKKLKQTVEELAKAVQEGTPLSEAMEAHPSIFSRLFTSLVKSGESTGSLETVLESVATMMKRDMELARKIRGALIFPGITLALAMCISYYLLTNIVPQFAGLLTGMGGQLPPITKVVIGISNFLIQAKFFIVIIAVAAWLAFKRYYATEGGRMVIDRFKLRIPVMKDLTVNLTITRLCRSMALLQNAGVKIDESIRINLGIADNAVYEASLEAIGNEVEQGQALFEALNLFPQLYPDAMRAMVHVGHMTGQTTELLNFAGDYYDELASEQAGNLAQAVEPVMIIFVGALIGTIVIAMFMPYFAIINTLTGS